METCPTECLGYVLGKAVRLIIKISKNGKFVDFASTVDELEVIPNQTPFYRESGGQVGDQGYIFKSNYKIKINDTQKKMGDLFVIMEKLKRVQFLFGKALI